MKKAERKAAIDYAFHCIITDLGDAQLEEMGELIHEHQVQALHGLSRRAHGR